MKRFEPNWDSLKTHRVPSWYDQAKIGVLIHWGLYSVPAFAPPVGELGTIPDDEWFVANPYAEWYFNSVNVGRGPTWEHHQKTYGSSFRYEQFADLWKAENWRPDRWAELFRRAGARYVVLTAKHHDGFCLFPSRYTDYNALRHGPGRDVVGELTRSVREQGMRMGLYYSGIIDWCFHPEPIFNDRDVRQCNCPTGEYADYAYHQVMELIDRYHPSVLWNDIGWPYAGEHMLPHLLAHYYNTCPEGVVNDRFNGLFYDYTTKEYHQGEMNRKGKWENVRGLGLSFGYNTQEDSRHILSSQALVRELVATASNGGNLLINVGPMADGTVPPIQEKSLLGMGKWLSCNGEAIYNSERCNMQPMTEGNCRVSFTQKGEDLYIIVDSEGPGQILLTSIRTEGESLTQISHVRRRIEEQGLVITVEKELDCPVVLKALGAAQDSRR